MAHGHVAVEGYQLHAAFGASPVTGSRSMAKETVVAVWAGPRSKEEAGEEKEQEGARRWALRRRLTAGPGGCSGVNGCTWPGPLRAGAGGRNGARSPSASGAPPPPSAAFPRAVDGRARSHVNLPATWICCSLLGCLLSFPSTSRLQPWSPDPLLRSVLEGKQPSRPCRERAIGLWSWQGCPALIPQPGRNRRRPRLSFPLLALSPVGSCPGLHPLPLLIAPRAPAGAFAQGKV